MPKKSAPEDPYAVREAQTYDNPIASREYILEQLKKAARPLTRSELEGVLKLEDDDQREALRRRLRAMERDGQVMCNRRGAYGLVDKMDLVRGRVQAHRDGFGFLIPDAGGDDLYLSSRQMGLVFDGDIALARISGVDRRGRQEGTIVEVLEHNTRQLVGRYNEQDGVGTVVADNTRIHHDVLIPSHATNGARNGQYVVVGLTAQPGKRQQPRGEILEVLGEHMAPGMEIEVAIRNYGIPFQWSEGVMEEAQALAPEPSEEDKQGRVDIRDLPLVTIDGEDARDFDDAVCCEPKKGGGWRLWVAIADVSHYVKVGSALDADAHLRATSVYFPDRVVPMLPEALSNGLCSLKPKVDRLCMVCEMTISAAGRLSGYRFFEGVMHSKARLTYNKVAAMLDPKHSDHQQWAHEYASVLPNVQELYRLYKALRSARDQRGAIDFETTETRVIFSSERKIERIVPVERNDAHKLIEECMLAANVATARFLEKVKLPALYRVHQGPPPEKLASVRKFLGELGLNLGGGDKPSPTDYQALLSSVQNRPDANVIQSVMLRSMSQARYQAENEGHFGLHYQAYTHFTSPIRRYPDLVVHRALRFLVRGGGGDTVMRYLRGGRNAVVRPKGVKAMTRAEIYPYNPVDLAALGEHCSTAERRADEATRDVMAWLKCEYLQDRVGDTFDGVITAVTGFGLFVELRDVYVEGLVHVSALPGDYYHFDAVKHRLVGEKTSKSYQLGGLVQVQVARVDLDQRKVDLELIGEAAPAKPQKEKRGRQRKRRR